MTKQSKPMGEALFRRLLGYKSAMAQAKVLLNKGIITPKEFSPFDTISAIQKR